MNSRIIAEYGEPGRAESRLGIKIIVTAICALCLMISEGQAGSEKGPLHVTNRFPPHILFLKPVPDSPRPVPKNRFEISLSADYSSTFVNETSEEWSVLADMEMSVTEISVRYGVTEYLSLSADIPGFSMNAGFLDGFLADFHKALGVGNYGRETRPEDVFGYSLKKNGNERFDAESGGLHLGDISLSSKLCLMSEKNGLLKSGTSHSRFFPESIALSYTLKIPVGNKDRGLGSGGFDHGLSLLSQFRLFPSLLIYLNPGIIFLSEPESDLSFDNTIFAFFWGGEYLLNDSWSLFAQWNYCTSPFENTGIRQLDEDSLELQMGFACALTRSLNFEFAFCEDLTRSEPDFNVHTRFVYRFE